jgi:hypothetical protein
VFKLGSTIPVKFKLTNQCFGSNLAAKIYVTQLDNNPEGTVLEAVSTSAADTGNQFRYDAAGAQYIFNLSTKLPFPTTPPTYWSKGDWKIRIDFYFGDPANGGYIAASKYVKISLKP